MNRSSSRAAVPRDPVDPIRHRGQDIIVTAGAGSGKTRTLVERYLSHLEEGWGPRELLAITFTEKAAREMRNRIRQKVTERAGASSTPEERERWIELQSGMDAARIGTIHGLCAEILRAHPAEAAVDPGFEVADEGWSAALKTQAVEDALAWTVGNRDAAPLFAAFEAASLGRVLAFLMQRRLDVLALLTGSAEERSGRVREAVAAELARFLGNAGVAGAVGTLRELQSSGSLEGDAGERLGAQVEGLLDGWQAMETALAEGQAFEAAAALHGLRRNSMGLTLGRKGSESKRCIEALRSAYTESVNGWLGGDGAKDPAPDPALEERVAEELPRLQALFGKANELYAGALRRESALDFDDLEQGALDLLERPEVAGRWSGALRAVLVDEFQDTNDRQRRIVEALCGGEAGKLFVVGDAQQSIYRFRGADVTVFRDLGEDIEVRGGVRVEIPVTYRSHTELLTCLHDVLRPILGEETAEAYRVPYRPLEADRKEPRTGIRPPHIEIVLGIGEGAAEARPTAAAVLAERLSQLRHEGQIRAWDEVALLFRASTGFPAYEDALQEWGIPFVTVAGRGFYDRPEIRDVLNLLHAVAEPQDDLALAGFLRSPAIGLSDATLYLLRWRGERAVPLRQALSGDLDALHPEDRERVERARQVLEGFEPLADRLPVAELLKGLIDRLDYRAVLAASHSRLWRNLDKLLDDAQASRIVRVREFLDYVRTLRDTGVREAEAPADAGGAVRLMTIHKAKGLEFDIVVLADASRQTRGSSEAAYLFPEVGLAVQPDRIEGSSLGYSLARWVDARQSQAEEDRLLYVAATRAREKWIVSGHITSARGVLSAPGWTGTILEALGLDAASLAGDPGTPRIFPLPCGQPLRIWCVEDPPEPAKEGREAVEAWPESDGPPLYRPILQVREDELDEKVDAETDRDWRASGDRGMLPAEVTG
ncbi:MAG: UvrD-helicase domain-containing protein, partial [Anaerolineales bacterium]|nr:UvrD-helicase domain-containing protein [Anaerolineales bacterium]